MIFISLPHQPSAGRRRRSGSIVRTRGTPPTKRSKRLSSRATGSNRSLQDALSGSSGTALIALFYLPGINIVHINTELRVAWRRGLEQGLSEQPHEVAPYKILRPAVESVEQVVSERLRLFARAETAAVHGAVPG